MSNLIRNGINRNDGGQLLLASDYIAKHGGSIRQERAEVLDVSEPAVQRLL